MYVGILCDTYSKEYITTKCNPNLSNLLQLDFVVGLDEYSELNREQMEKKGIFLGVYFEESHHYQTHVI